MKVLQSLLFILVAANAAASTASPESVIAASNAGWESAVNGGNADQLAAIYAADATVIAPSMEIVSAHEEIGKFWAAQHAAGIRGFRVETVNLRADGDLLYQTAVWSARVQHHGGHAGHAVDGEMTNVLERQADGSWKIRLQHWY